jgi:hypothetical protein
MLHSAELEFWQAEVNGRVYEAGFEELANRISDGSVKQGDKVRKGNLRWIEAGKVPALIEFFNARENGMRPPIVTSVTDASSDPSETAGHIIFPTAESPVLLSVTNVASCPIHDGAELYYSCTSCGTCFCRSCPRSYGGSVKICPSCGGMCKSLDELRSAAEKAQLDLKTATTSFGSADLIEALAYPLKFKTSLFFGALMFAFFSIGQSAGALGGIFMIVAAMFSFMLANTLTFGVLANVADKFSRGLTNSNFMPDFDDFSLWEDVIHPFFLSIAVYISSFGAFLVIVVVGLYFVFSTVAAEDNTMQSTLETLPGTHYYDTSRAVQQTEQVKRMIGDLKNRNDRRLKAQEQLEQGELSEVSRDTEADVQNSQELINKAQEDRLESSLGKMPETRRRENSELISRFMKLAAPLVVLAGLSLLWGMFYVPAACAVAGYTRSFMATLNPSVGLDTIKKMGADYLKLVAMFLLLCIFSGTIGMILSALLSPFDLPGFGNLPARAIGSLFTFYFSVVFSCLIGFALHKASGRLGLAR